MSIEQRELAPVSGVARWGRKAFVGVTVVLLAALATQVFLAGMSIFVSASWWATHTVMAFFIEWLPIAMMVLAVVGRFPRAFPLLCLLLLGQIILQYVFIEVGAQSAIRWIAALHPVNALAMFTVALFLLQKARSMLG